MALIPVATYDFAGTGALSGDWTQGLPADASVTRVSGEAACDTDAVAAIAHWNADSFDDDQYSQIVVKALASYSLYCGIVARSSGQDSTNDCYAWVMDGASGTPQHNVLARNDNGTATVIQDYSQAGSLDDVMRMDVVGSDIKMYINGSQVGSTEVDATYASGAAGVEIFNDEGRGDDWEGGNLVFPPTIGQLFPRAAGGVIPLTGQLFPRIEQS